MNIKGAMLKMGAINKNVVLLPYESGFPFIPKWVGTLEGAMEYAYNEISHINISPIIIKNKDIFATLDMPFINKILTKFKKFKQ